MNRIIGLISFIFVIALMACSKTPTNPSQDVTSNDKNGDIITEEIIIDYFNQTLPVHFAQLFGPPGYLSNNEWHWHGTPVFSPNGKEMYFSKYIKATNAIEIWYTVFNKDTWGIPVKFSIPGIEGSYNCPVFTDDGTELYFIQSDGISFTIYKVTRDGDTWINPEALELNIPEGKLLGWSFSLSQNKNIYFLLWDLNGLEHQQIYRSVFNNGVYNNPEALTVLDIGSEGVGGPNIAKDESYIIFDSVRDGGYGMHDLYISFRDDSGEFLTPINLGNQVNTSEEDTFSTITPDGLYLFFVTTKSTDLGYNPYWIKLDEIDVFK